MSDSDFSDVEDSIQPSKPSLMSVVTLRAILVTPSNGQLQARLGGTIYPWSPLKDDETTIIKRAGNTEKPTAAARSTETLLEIGLAGSADSNSLVVSVNVLEEGEPSQPVEKGPPDGSFKVRFVWVLGENPSHPRVHQTLRPTQSPAKKLDDTPPPPLPTAPQGVTPEVVAAAGNPVISPTQMAPRETSAKPDFSPPPVAAPVAVQAAATMNTATNEEPAVTVLQLQANDLPTPGAPPTSKKERRERQRTAPEDSGKPLSQEPAPQRQPAPSTVHPATNQTSTSTSDPLRPAHHPSHVDHPATVATTGKPTTSVLATPAPAASSTAPPPSVGYDCATLQNNMFLHVEFVKVLRLKVTDPTTYAEFSVQQKDGAAPPSSAPSLASQTTHVVKRSSNPIFRTELSNPIPVPYDQLKSFIGLIQFQVFEKKLVTAPVVLAQGAVQVSTESLLGGAPTETLIPCGGDTVAVLRVRLSPSPTSVNQLVHPRCSIPHVEEAPGDGIGILQLEIVRADLRKEECIAGVYFAQFNVHSGNGSIVTHRTLAVLVDNATPLWLYSTAIEMKYQAVSLDFAVVRSNSLKKTEDTIAVFGKLDIPSRRQSDWNIIALELSLPPGEAAKKEKSNDAGVLHVKYRTIASRLLKEELDAKKASFLQPLLPPPGSSEGNDAGTDPSTIPPRVLSKYSVKLVIAKSEMIVTSTPKDKFSDSQIVIRHSEGKEVRSNIVRVDAASSTESVYELEVQMEPAFRVQQFSVSHVIPSAKMKCVGRGVADVDILACEPGVPYDFPVVLEARVDGDEKEFAEDVALLNRAQRVHFGIVTLRVIVQRLDYWSNASVLDIASLKLSRANRKDRHDTVDLPTQPVTNVNNKIVVVWFRNHRDFTIPKEHVHVAALDSNGAMQGSLQIPTTFPLNNKGQLAPLCFALLEADASVPDQLENLNRTLSSMFSAVEKRVYEVEGLGSRSLEEVNEHLFQSASKEIMIHVQQYIEVDVTSTLMEAATLSRDMADVKLYGSHFGALAFAGTAPLSPHLLLHCAGSWGAVAEQLRESSVPDTRVHGFDVFSERLWVVRARTVQYPVVDTATTSTAASVKESKGHHNVSFHLVSREVQVPAPPGFDPIVEEVLVDVHAPEGFTEPFHVTAFAFGVAHNSRTDVVLSHPAGNPIALMKLDMLVRTCALSVPVLAEDDQQHLNSSSRQQQSRSSLHRPAVALQWFHGNRGASDVDERHRRKDLETEWRISQQEAPQRKLLVTFLGRSETMEPPRLSGATLTRCEGAAVAMLVGGLDETSQPLGTFFSYAVKEGTWSLWTPSRVTTMRERDQPWQSSSFAVNTADFAKASEAAALQKEWKDSQTKGLTFSARHGHSSVFCSSTQQLIVYGGIGPGGFDPACVTEDGYVAPSASVLQSTKKQRNKVPRNGYLSDVWFADLKHQALRLADPTVDPILPEPLKAMHHAFRWRHTAVCFNVGMYVFGGKTVVVKSVTVPYDMKEQRSRAKTIAQQDAGQPETTYFVAEEIPCSCEYISVLDTVMMTWSVVHTSGAPPCPRYGHGTTLVGSKVYLFGGRNATDVFNDLYVLDLETLHWEEILPFGTLLPPPLELAGLCHCAIDEKSALVVTGGRAPGINTDKLAVYYFYIETSYWHVLPFNCAPGNRRIAPAICNITSSKRRPSTGSLKRLPYEFGAVLQLLVVGGDRGVEDDGRACTPSVRQQWTAREENEFFDGSNIRPRPSGAPCVINVAIDPGELAHRMQPRGAGRLEENVLCPHLRFRDASIPGWALEKSVNRLSTRPPSPAPPKVEKKGPPLSAAAQAAHLERLDADIAKRRQSKEQRMHDAYTEVREMSSKFVRADVKQWDDEQWLSHYYRVYYKPALKYSRSRNLPAPRLPEKLQGLLSAMALEDGLNDGRDELTSENAKAGPSKLQSATDMSRVNARLYYQPIQAMKESSEKLRDSVLRPTRPQSATRVTRRDIEDSIDRLHRGPPSPLSSQKYGPSGRAAYTPTKR